MTKGTKAFRIVVCVLLGLTMIWTAYISYAFIYYATDEIRNERYGVYVGGVDVTHANASDVLGDGTVSYDARTNKLTLKNANIVYDYSILYSEIDLLVELVGENKFVLKDGKSNTAVYVSNDILRKDLSFFGDGTLEISFENATENATGIVADDLWIGSDITVTTPDCSNISNGIVCTSSLTLRNNATVTVNNGAARSSTALSVRGNAIIESNSTLNVTVNAGATATCNGVCVDGNLSLGKNALLNVSVADQTAELSECISVYGTMTLGRHSTVNASAQEAYAIHCNASVSASEGATVSASSEEAEADIFCYGAFVNYGATVNAETEALGGIHNKLEN